MMELLVALQQGQAATQQSLAELQQGQVAMQLSLDRGQAINANRSAMVGSNALIPVPNAAGVVPAWFPATLLDLDAMTALHSNSLLDLYELEADPADGVGTTHSSRRRNPVARYIGVRTNMV